MPPDLPFCVSRRAIFATLPGVVLLPVVVAACSSSESASPTTSGNEVQGTSTAGQGVQVEQSKVPVGKAIVVTGKNPYVVAQPTAGKFVAFSAVCTHRGTTVGAGDGLTLVCPAHGSEFNAATGAVEHGPATKPLPSAPITAANGML